MAAHGRRKVHQISDRYLAPKRFRDLPEIPSGRTFPQLPPASNAPPELRDVLRHDAADILKGRWIAFGYLPLQLEDPPRWHKDYLVGVDLSTNRPALKLHHRLEGKADIKLMWEPSRWYSLARLAQAAYVLGDVPAAEACLRWLQDWVDKNPPYFGWNWTSGLESGLRLIQFTWIDTLLDACCQRTGPGAWPRETTSKLASSLAEVRRRLLPPHLWFTWRDRSFGSSANNHVIGELSGLILGLVRWPGLTRWAAPLATVQRLWEEQVLAQFAPDGGNQEQALNYHLFSFEFCWQARMALRAAGASLAPAVEDRLRLASGYFNRVQARANAWDYGDSDNAFVTPLFERWTEATSEWYRWLNDSAESPAIRYWLGDAPKPLHASNIVNGAQGWQIYPNTGYAIYRTGDWFLRWDLSPLGFLATAGHGHCDALHLSVWFRGEPVFIDPGTGAYHANRPLRDYLASWEAHNGPHPVPAAFPERRGAFLWSGHHELPRWQKLSDLSMRAELRLPTGTMHRTITRLESENGWQMDDGFQAGDSARSVPIQVLWQLAPGAILQNAAPGSYQIQIRQTALGVVLDPQWKVTVPGQASSPTTPTDRADFRGSCAPAFRRIEKGPFLLLAGSVQGSSTLQTRLTGK